MRATKQSREPAGKVDNIVVYVRWGVTSGIRATPEPFGMELAVKRAHVRVVMAWVTCREVFTRGPQSKVVSLQAKSTGLGDLSGSLHMRAIKQSREPAGKAVNIVVYVRWGVTSGIRATPEPFGMNLPQLLDSKGGSHGTNVPNFDKDDFTSWKVRFLVFLDGLEPYLLKTLEDGSFVPMLSLSTSDNPLPKRQNQWSNAESRLANQDKRLKSIIISCLPNDVMKSVIKCQTAKEIWNDLILAHEGPSYIRDTKIAALRLKFNAFKSLEGEKVMGTFTRLKCLLNDLENNGVMIPQAGFNVTFVNSLPRKWLSMNQTQRANNSIKNDSLATLYGKYNYEEDVEENQRTNNEFMVDLNAEFHERALLANQKRFYKRSVRLGAARKPIDKSKETCFSCGKPGGEELSVARHMFRASAILDPFIGLQVDSKAYLFI
ncbi:hypothetical protein Tco_0805730 [Tanacetum coccineum]